MGLVQTSPSAAAVTLAEAKAHLRIDGNADDAVLSSLIVAATQYVETETRTAIVGGTFRLTLDSFPAGPEIKLPRPPLSGVSAVKYLDPAGAEQTLSASLYVADTAAKPGRISLRPGSSWPATNGDANCVRIDFTAGHGDAASVPNLLKQCVLLMVGHWFENREAAIDRRIDTVPLAVESIVNQHAYPEAV